MNSQRRLSFLLLVLAMVVIRPIAVRADVPLRLITECSKQSIFYGETITCYFVLTGEDEIVDVEVAKFPEFRGFWSENTTLRQNTMSLLIDPRDPSIRRVVVGSYILTPMLSDTTPTIEPMRLVIRRPLSFNAEEEVNLSSETPSLVVRKLPPAPAELAGAFRGAVGQFQFGTEFTEIPFTKDAPISLRFFLQGEGNFHEILEPSVSFPEAVEKVGVRNWSQGTAQFPTKVFEFTLVVHSDQSLQLPAVDFVYFNPSNNKYEKLQTPPILFRHVVSETPLVAEIEELPVRLHPQFSSPILKQPLFLIFNALAGLLLLTLIAIRLRRRKSGIQANASGAVAPIPKAQNDPRAQLAEAKAALAAGDVSLFLRITLSILTELEKAPGPAPATELASMRHLAERYLYSSDKSLPEDLSRFSDELSRYIAGV